MIQDRFSDLSFKRLTFILLLEIYLKYLNFGVREVLGPVVVPQIELLVHTGTYYSRLCIILIKVNPLYC